MTTSTKDIAVKALQSVFMGACGEEKLPELNFLNDLVVRSPHLWVLLFEERTLTAESFTNNKWVRVRVREPNKFNLSNTLDLNDVVHWAVMISFHFTNLVS
jgi:hypothetical protein